MRFLLSLLFLDIYTGIVLLDIYLSANLPFKNRTAQSTKNSKTERYQVDILCNIKGLLTFYTGIGWLLDIRVYDINHYNFDTLC